MILDTQDIGSQLGSHGVDGLLDKAEQYCTHEVRRLELRNQPSIRALKAEMSVLLDQEAALQDRLRFAPPPGGLRRQRQKKIYAWAIAILLTFSTFAFAVLTFEPFRLGWKSYLYCLGIAVVLPFLVEQLLEDQKGRAIVKVLTILAATAGIGSLMLLAAIRADLLRQQVQSAAVVVMDDAQPAPEAPNTFYQSTLGLLGLATILLSLAMELGGGLALREAWSSSPESSEDWSKLRSELRLAQLRMVGIVHEVSRLETEPAQFTHTFWRDFHGSMIAKAVRSAMTKSMMLGLVLTLVCHAYAESTPHLNLVVAIDLSKSVAVKGPDGATEFQKNVDGVARLLAQVPADSHVAVIGITDHSFAQPFILLSATVPGDPGYFGERLTSARNQLVQTWKRRSASLEPAFPGTDVIGALLLASQIFNRQLPNGERRMLVLFSDMRNHTPELDLESPESNSTRRSTKKDLRGDPIDLRGVQTYMLGVEGPGRSTLYWQTLREYWQQYLQNSGAQCTRFSVLRQLPLFR